MLSPLHEQMEMGLRHHSVHLQSRHLSSPRRGAAAGHECQPRI